MPIYQVRLFAADNFLNPQNPGFLPAEDASFLSSLTIGQTMTYQGGGEQLIIRIDDPAVGNATFDEAQTNQRLVVDPPATSISFGGTTYANNQIVTPTWTIVFTGSDGQTYTLTSFNFSGNTEGEIPDGAFFEGAVPPPGTVLTVQQEINPTGPNSRPYEDFFVCFEAETLIETTLGPIRALDIKVGTEVLTGPDRTPKPVRWVGHRHCEASELAAAPKLRPVRIAAGALGSDLPARDLWVSRQHRMLVRSRIAERMFGALDVLVPAVQLVGLPGIDVDLTRESVTYVHFLCDNHEIVWAEGAATESLLTGPEALRAMSDAARDEILTLFPELAANGLVPARPITQGQEARSLVLRHKRNSRALWSDALLPEVS